MSQELITHTRKVLTLVFVRNGSEVLLGMKKRGFGVGKWNGFGGKVHNDESIEDGAIRELKEECGLDVEKENLKKIGLIDFEFKGDSQILEVHVFQSEKYSGTVTESEEMSPKWYNINDIPYDSMWLDDTYWYPYMFGNKVFKAHFLYEGFDKILEHTITEIESF